MTTKYKPGRVGRVIEAIALCKHISALRARHFSIGGEKRDVIL